jgi:hypothetical protein
VWGIRHEHMHVCIVRHGPFTAAEFQGASVGAVAGFVTMHTLIALHTPAHIEFFTRRRVRDGEVAVPTLLVCGKAKVDQAQLNQDHE